MNKEIIINEKKYSENIIQSETLAEDISANMAIIYMTRYYYEYSNMSLEEMSETIFNKMESFNLSVTVYQEYIASDIIKRIYNSLKSGNIDKLRSYDTLPLYKSEYEKIMQCENDREKKILFTLYILARYTNRYGWVYNPENEIYKLGNVSTTTKNRIDIFASLLNKGLIKYTKKVDDLKIGVELSDSNDEVILEINEFKNLGNKFMAFIKDDYILCEECGKLVKIKSKKDYSTKYCDKCSSYIKNEQNKEYYHEKVKNLGKAQCLKNPD